MTKLLTRRTMLGGAALGAGGLLSGCDALNRSPAFQNLLATAETGNFHFQRALGDRMELASEYTTADLSPTFRANGTRNPDTQSYNASAANGFFRLAIAFFRAGQQTAIFFFRRAAVHAAAHANHPA